MAEQKRECDKKKLGCGGCPNLDLSYEDQLKKKQKYVKKLLENFGKVQPIIGMQDPWHYRNKAISTFSNGSGNALPSNGNAVSSNGNAVSSNGNVVSSIGNGKRLVSGIYKEGTHQVIPVDTCLLHHPRLDEAIKAVRDAAAYCKYKPYDEDRHTGLIRHVLVRHSRLTDEVLVVLITASSNLPGSRAFVKKVRERCPNVASIVQNINARSTSAVLGFSEKTLFGRGYIVDELCGIRFRIAASSFYQVNPVQTEILYQTAIDLAGLDKRQTVLDAYCGVGTIGLAAASRAKHVLGIERNGSAVKCAVQNARDNKITNASFVNADATAAIQKMAARGERMDVVFMDPPRAGSTPEFLDAVNRMRPDRLVYVSCNPETQQRDLGTLREMGWQVKRIQPVDMFPHTGSVETVCLLSKLNAKQHIEVEVKMDELDLTSAESKATYEEIKEYVLEHTGLKVSHLYIAQVKRKNGIIERANYNLPKNEDAKQPVCPPEKEKAITEALLHFGMI